MAWAGGTFTRANPTWATDASLGIGIEAGRHDAQDNDFTTGINQCLNKDGSNSATGNLNFGGYLPTNVAAGTAAAPAYCPGNDVNTGMYGPAADTLAFATNGTERIRIDSAGFTSINDTPDATYRLRIGGRLRVGGQSSGDSEIGMTSQTTPANTAWQWAVRSDIGGNNDDLKLMRFVSGSYNSIAAQISSSTGNVTFGNATGNQFVVVNGGSSGTAGGAYIGALLNGTSKALLGNYSGIIGGAYNGDPMLYFQGGTPRVVGIPAGVGNRFMKWDTTDSQWTYDTSSARFKENIVDSHYGLQAVLALQSREFDYKNPAGRHDVGFIAEEVVNVIPEVVGLDKDGLPEAVMYDRLTSVLCKAIQELNAKVEALEAKVADLEAVTEL